VGCRTNRCSNRWRLYDDKDVQEWIIRRSKLDWVIVRPVILTDGPKTNAYRALADPRSWTCGFISRADVADFQSSRSTTMPFCIRRRCSRADVSAAAAEAAVFVTRQAAPAILGCLARRVAPKAQTSFLTSVEVRP
jgi:NAD(P)H-binding